MKERPIIFNAPMVRALLAGRKWQTRRGVKRQLMASMADSVQFAPDSGVARFTMDGVETLSVSSPYGVPGDRLWVKESVVQGDAGWLYRADRDLPLVRWRSPLHMPRAASRLTLDITAMRVERLHDVSESDAIAEGVDAALAAAGSARQAYQALWEQINGAGSWEANPWVWVLQFRVSPSATASAPAG